LRAYGDASAVAVQNDITPAQAKRLFRRSVMVLGAQIAISTPDQIEAWVEGISEVASAIETTGGFESIFASALFALQSDTDATRQAVQRWSILPLDERPGGGHKYSIAFRADAGNFLQFQPTDLSQVTKLATGGTSDVKSKMSMRFSEASMTHDQCKTIAGIVGSAIGEVSGGLAGAAVGGLVGAAGGIISGRGVRGAILGAGSGAVVGGMYGAGEGKDYGNRIGTVAGDIVCDPDTNPVDGQPGGGPGGNEPPAQNGGDVPAAPATGGNAPAAPVTGGDGSGNGEPPDDDEEDVDPEGCYGPWQDLIWGFVEPYGAFALGKANMLVATGAGLEACISERNGFTRIDRLESLAQAAKSIMYPSSGSLTQREINRPRFDHGGVANTTKYSAGTYSPMWDGAGRSEPRSTLSGANRTIRYSVETSVTTISGRVDSGPDIDADVAGSSLIRFSDDSDLSRQYPNGIVVAAGEDIPVKVLRLMRLVVL
jgi:hypothetical protein